MLVKTKWALRNDEGAALPRSKVERLKNEIMTKQGCGRRTAEILMARGIQTADAVYQYFNPSMENLHSPFLFEAMDKAIERILSAKTNNEKICLYGDYDADGTTGVAILYDYMKSNGFKVRYFIPNRLVTGYGLHVDPLRELINDGVTLLITVDNGISANAEIDFCRQNKLDVIVTDHHEPQAILPDAYAILNPKVKGSTYPFKELCGAGVALKLLQALSIRMDRTFDFEKVVGCVALATVADLVPLIDENRIIVSLGMDFLNKGNQNPGIRALIDISELTEIKAWHFGFVLGPKINVAGRLGEADHVIELLTGTDETELMRLATFLSDENKKRQLIEATILEEALKKIEDCQDDVVIVAGENWHSGVIGIVASRIQEVYYRPVIVISIENGVGKASCRSIEGFNIFLALQSCAECFISFGGHAQAAGFSIEADLIETMCEKIRDYAQKAEIKKHLFKKIQYDTILNEDEITWDLFEEFAQFEPCGLGNPGIRFVLNEPEISSMRTMGKDDSHLRLTLKNNLNGVGFRFGHFCKAPLKVNGYKGIELLCRLDVNHYRGEKNLQLMMTDIRTHPLWDVEKIKSLMRALVQADNPQEEINWEMEDIQPSDLFLDRNMVKSVYLQLKKRMQQGVPLPLNQVEAVTPFHVLCACEVLREAELVTYSLKNEQVFFKMMDTNEKKDIQNTKLMIKLRKIMCEE